MDTGALAKLEQLSELVGSLDKRIEQRKSALKEMDYYLAKLEKAKDEVPYTHRDR